MQGIRVAPPAVAAHAGRGVEAVLRRSKATCLEAALVRQHWLAVHGVICDVVIGVTAPGAGFRAHAWLDESLGSTGSAARPWHELTRLPAPMDLSTGTTAGSKRSVQPLADR
jgi:hypothetical protein